MLVLNNGLVQSALLFEEIAEIDVSLSVVSPESDGPGVMNFGILQATERAQCKSDVVVKGRNPIVQRDRLSNQVHRQFIAASLMGNDAEQMQRLDVICIEREYFFVTDLSFGKLTRSMLVQS